MLMITTKRFMRFLRMNIESSWNKHPSEMIDERMPVKLSSSPKTPVSVAKNEPVTKIDTKYSTAASMMYKFWLRFNCFSKKVTSFQFVPIISHLFQKINKTSYETFS